MKNILFKNGKTALFAGFDLYKIKKNTGVLLPKFICNDLYLELDKKFRVFLYDLDDFLNPDLKKIKKIDLKKKNIQVFIFVHYFGYYFEVDKIKNFCKKKKIILIEDNSHGYGSKYKGKFIGTKSNFSFSSPHKTISNINSGGNLMLKNVDHKFVKKFKRDNSLKRKFFNTFLFLKKIKFIRLLKYIYNNFENKKVSKLLLIDSYNREKLKQINFKKLSNQKNKNFNVIKKEFDKLKIKLHYFNYDSTTIPWFFSAVYNSKDKKIIEKLIINNNFITVNWPSDLPLKVYNDRKIKKFKNNIILIKI